MADLYYIEEGYYDAGYFVYTADAASAPTFSATVTAVVGKIIEQDDDLTVTWDDITSWDGIPSDQWTSIGVWLRVPSTLTAALDLVIGETVYGEGTWSSQFSVSVTVNKFTGITSSQSATFTQTAQISRIAGLSSSQSAAFTQTVQTSKTVQAISNLSAQFTQTSTISHIEGVDLFAFSNAQLTAAVSRIRDNNIAASAVFSVATDATRTRNLSSEDIAVFSAIINGLRSRNVNLNAEAAFSFSASLNGVNSVSSAISSVSTLTATVGKRIVAQAALTSQFTVSADVFDLTERPRQFTQVGSPAFSDSIKQFGTHSYYSTNTTNYVTIPDSNSWSTSTWRTFDAWVFIPSDGSQIGSFNQALLRQFASSTSNQTLTIDLTSSGINKIFRFRINAASGASTVALKFEDTTNGIIGYNTWAHIRVLNDGASYHLWINGSKKLLTSEGNTTYISNLNVAAPVEINRNSLPSNYSHPLYMDELLITTSTITGSGTSSFSVPTTAWLAGDVLSQADVLVLSHFDGVFNDDQQIIKTGAGAFTSTATFTASAVKTSGPLIATTIASVSTVATTVTKTAGTSTAYLVAQFNLSSEVISSQNGELIISSTLAVTARKTARITQTLANTIVLSALSNNTAGSITAFLTATSSFTATPFRADKNPAPIALDNYRLYHLDSPPSTFDGQFLRATYFQERAKFGADAILNPTSGDALGYVPGYYPANGDDWSIDFWHRGRTNSTGSADWKAIATIFGNRWLEFDGNGNRYRIRGLMATGDPAGFNSGAPGAGYYPRLAYNWTHIAIQRKSDVFTFFVNGVSAGSLSDTITTTSEVSFGTNTNGSLSWTATPGAFDEIRINTLEAYYIGNFTPATAAYATEAQDYYTVESVYALLEPRATLTATPTKLVVTSAALSATSTINALAVKTATTTKELATVVTIVATAGKRVDVIGTFSAAATISAISTPTREFASAMAVSTEVNATAERFRDPTATNAASTASISAVTGFRKQFTADFSSQGGFNIVVVGTRAGVALLESQFALAAEPKITRNVPAALAASVGLTAVVGFLKEFNSNQSAEFTQEVTSFIKVPVQFNADLAVTATTAVSFIRYREAAALIESNSAVTAVAIKRPDAFVTMSVISSQVASAERFRDPTATALVTTATETSSIERFRDVIAPLASEFAVTATATRIKPLASALNCEFAVSFLGGRLNDIDLVSPSFATVTASVTKSTDTQAAFSSQFASSTENIRVRFATTAMTTTASVAVTAVKTARITKTLDTAFSQAAAFRRFRDPNPTAISAQFTQTANGIKGTDVEGNLSATATVVVEITVSKAIQAEAALFVNSTISTLNGRRRNTASALAVTATTSTNIRKLTGFTLAVASTTTLTANLVFYFRGGSASLASQGFVLTAGEVINIDPRLQLIIKPETRRLLITSETRILQVL